MNELLLGPLARQVEKLKDYRKKIRTNHAIAVLQRNFLIHFYIFFAFLGRL